MTKRNAQLRLKVVDDHCMVCGKPNGLLTSKKPKFKASVSYSSGGVCENCKPNFDKMIDILAAGGIMVVCNCGGVSAAMEAPGFEDQIIQMPNGGRRLDIQTCGLCSQKEGDDVTEVPGGLGSDGSTLSQHNPGDDE